MKATKRILSLLLVLSLVLSLCPLTLFAAAKAPSYEAPGTLAALTEGQYVISLWRYIGQANAEGVVFHSVNDASIPASKNEDYSLLTNEELPASALWTIAPAEGGYTIRNLETGLYLGDSIPAASEEPVVHKIVEGDCNGVHNYAIGKASGTGSLRYSNSSKSFSFNSTAPETEVTRAYAANVLLHRVVVPEPQNVAPNATASTATCASWNKVSGVNDGQVPGSSQGNQAGAYGSWGQNNACNDEIITLTWNQPVELEGAGVYFWHDNGKDNRTGIDFPAAYSFQYLLEDGETWADVENPEGLEVLEDVMNQTAFDGVTTKGLRLVMVKESADDNSYGLGVAEIEAYGWLTALDTAALEAAIAKAEAITNLDNYTEESVAALNEALAAARAVLEDPASQAAIDAAAAALEAAVTALVIKPVEKPAEENIAPQGTAAASYCASWNSVAGVNDQDLPAQSQGNQAGAYGSWGQNNNANPEPITITFAQEATLTGAGLYFWTDQDDPFNQNGINFPRSYTFEYLEGEEWKPVENARGMNNQPDVVNYSVFTPVTTTALRVLLVKASTGSYGLGVAEFEIYGSFGAPEIPVDKSELEAAITEAQAVERENYTEDSLAALEEALAAAQTVLADEAADQAAVDAAAEALRAAIAALTPKEPEPREIQMFAGSDIQGSSDWNKHLDNIAKNAFEAGHDIKLSFWCGDYADGSVYADGSDTSATETPERIQYIQDILHKYWPGLSDFYFAQGNHDGSMHIGSVIDVTGPKEYEDFVLYQINEDDFPWWQAGYSSYSSEDTCLEKINATTETLGAYLDGLIEQGDERVIFIYTHVPLHWTSRTTTMNAWWSDNIHADILFNMLNEKAEDIDIVFLYGHNHSENYADAYPDGGTVNFFAPGDSIRIPNGQVAASGNYTEEIIKFTYLNAGYVGKTAAGFSPSVATASVITVKEDRVEFTRYSDTGHYEGSDRVLMRNQRGVYPAYLQLSSLDQPNARKEGDTETFQAVLKNAEAASYTWSLEGPAEILEGQGTDTAVVRYTGGGEVTVKVTVSYRDAENAEQSLEQSLTVEVKGAPAPGSVTYQEVTSAADFAPGKKYAVVAWRYFGGSETDSTVGYGFGADKQVAYRAPTQDNYATISPETELPDEALWYIVPVEGGVSLRNVGTGKYLGASIPAASDEPYALTLAEGECSGVYNMAIGTASGSIRYSNSSGTFVYSSTAPDGEVTRAWAANLTVYEKIDPPVVYPNIAPLASAVEAPYCASWNNLAGVNDELIPSASNTAGDNTAYGSWRSNGTADPEYISFRFDKPVEIKGAAAYFLYNENSPHEQFGIDFPDAYTYEYLNDAGQWVEVPDAAGYGLEENILNATDFAPVSTTAFRIAMQRQAGAFGLGVGEIEIYGVFVTLDTAALEAAIAQAEALEETAYTPESWANLPPALEAAKAALENASSQAAIDAAAEALLAAIAALEEMSPDYVDKAALREAIAQAEALTEADWTPESWAALQEALTAARTVEADEAADQEQVDAATEALLAAIDALVDKVQALIDQIDALPEPISLEDAEALAAAREAYEALTEEEQARVSNYEELLLKEIEYYTLLAEQALEEARQAAIKALEAYEAHAAQDHDEAHVAATEAALAEAVETLKNAPDSEALRAAVEAGIAAINEALKGGELPKPEDPKPEDPKPEDPKPAGDFRFDDVQNEKAFYFNPVYWAVEQGITKGTTKTTFGPNDACTRGQVVTFLWRAAGAPKAARAENPFTDVKEGSYCYDAVLWAVSQGITKGVTDTSFEPDGKCTRAQVVTFLYRFAKSPKVTADNPFTDVPAKSFYTNAVLWAVSQGITKGVSDTAFGPAENCTRAQVVTFLYRLLK